MKTRTHYIRLLAFVLAVFTLPLAAEADFSGTWEGAYYTPTVGYQRAAVSLVQMGSAVSGTYSSTTGLEGNLSGTAAGDSVEFTIAHSGSCKGFFYGRGVLDGDILRVDMGGGGLRFAAARTGLGGAGRKPRRFISALGVGG